jgi:polysaccharide pyruvyl transferase WcaK-like protein
MWLTLFPLALASRSRVPTAVLPSTVGPFRHWPSRALSQWVLRRTSLIMVRDGRSQRQVLAMGVDAARVVRIPDGVFRSRRPTVAESRAVADRLGFGDVRFGAVTVRTMPARSGRSTEDVKRFYDSMAETIRILLARDIVDRIAVVLQIEGHNESDARPAAELLKAVNDPRVRPVPSGLSPDELIAFYGAAQFVITSHLHSSIFSLVAGTPAFPFSLLGEKVDGVFEDLGLQRFVVNGRRFDPATLAETVAQTTANGESVRTEIRQAVDAAGAEAGRASDLLRAASNGDRRAK